jgi:hypothetical protein
MNHRSPSSALACHDRTVLALDFGMTILSSARRACATSVAVLAVAGALAGCGDSSRHASDGDTGAAAPATKIDLTRTPRPGDSSASAANPAGTPAAAPADTAGTRAKNSVKRRATRP